MMDKVLLKDLINIKNGTDYRHLKTGNIPVYGSGGYMTSVSDFLYNDESILLPRKGTLNNIMYVKGRFWTVDTMYWSEIKKEKVVPYFLFNYLKNINFTNLYSGSTLPSMTNNAYYSIKINLPNLSTQKAIARVLSSLDDKIELNNKINNELEAMARLIYDYWFVQFDFPDENGKPYKSSGGKMVYNQPLNRLIPEGWEVKKLKEFCDIITGKEDANFSNEKGKYAFFTCGNDILKCNQYAFNGKAVLVAGNGNFNVKYYEGKFNAYQRTYVIIPKNHIFVGIIYKSISNNIKKFLKGSNGSIVKFITKGDVENIYIITPINNNILTTFNSILSKTMKNIQENQKLTEIRDFILPMLMNGQVKVK